MSRNSYSQGFKKGLKKSKSDVGVSSVTSFKEAPPYDPPPPWISPQQRWNNSNYNNNLIQFLPRKVRLHRVKSAPLGFNIRGGPSNEYGAYVSKVLFLLLTKCISIVQLVHFISNVLSLFEVFLRLLLFLFFF